jgi:hypothetical protein
MLLTIFLFNVGGYYLVFLVLRYHSNEKLESVLDSGTYTEEGTIEIKIPMNMPYPIHPRGFERVNGEFEFDGEYYHLIKQKLDQDTLYIVLMKDVQEKHLVETMTEYANLSNDFGGSDQKALNFLGKLLKEYNSGAGVDIFEHASGIVRSIAFKAFSNTIVSRAESIPSPPPRS